MTKAEARIKAKLVELMNEVVKYYDDFKGTELEETVDKLLLGTVDTIKEFPEEEATPGTTPSKPEQAEQLSRGARLGQKQREILEKVKQGEAHYFGEQKSEW